MTTLPQKKKPTKAQKRLESRIKGYEEMIAKMGMEKRSAFTKPGSYKK